MIDENKTLEMFGYTSATLGRGSRKMVVRVCDNCDKIDVIIFNNYVHNKHQGLCKSCSTKGKNNPAWKGGKVTLVCKQCGNKFDVKPHMKNTAKFCSYKCRWKWTSENIVGENHHNWNPNLTTEDRVDHRSLPGYAQWRKRVFERDNYTCQVCGDSTGGNLIAHHIESYNSDPELRTTLSNGITMCVDCHNGFHHMYGRCNTNRDRLNEFMEMRYDG